MIVIQSSKSGSQHRSNSATDAQAHVSPTDGPNNVLSMKSPETSPVSLLSVCLGQPSAFP